MHIASSVTNTLAQLFHSVPWSNMFVQLCFMIQVYRGLTGWALPLYKFLGPLDHLNPLICGPQVQWFYIKMGS